jgi:FK506-binding protein 15
VVIFFSWQLSAAQAELQSQWEAKCKRLLASAKDEHLQQYQEVCVERDAHQQKVTRLQEKVALSLGWAD